LGAGASIPFKFPSGWELVREICRKLEGGQAIRQVLEGPLQIPNAQLNAFRSALAASRQPSVDQFLEFRAEFLDVGKAAISAALIPYEQIAHLRPEQRSWYDYLWDALRCPRDQFCENRLSIITYNYDRSLEQYLRSAIQNSYGISDDETTKLLLNIPIVHLHGSLGELSPAGRPYTSDLNGDTVRRAAGSIRVIHEEIVEPYQQAMPLIQQAEMICFLGFGYNPVNVERLGVANWKTDAGLFGTAYGYSDAERSMIHNERLKGRSFNFGTEVQDVLQFIRFRGLLP